MRRTLAQIAGIPATRRFREGGHVRGPGTATSDSIPAKLSDGEFVLPTDTVRKVGVRRMQDLVDMTHKPSGKATHPAQYADGGPVLFGVQDQQPAPRNVAIARAEAMAPELEEIEKEQFNAVGLNRSAPVGFADGGLAELKDRVAQIPTGGLTAPPADGSQDRWSNTETGRNLSNLAAALPGSMGGAVPVIAKTGGAISGGIDAATRLLNAGAGAAVVSAIPGAVSAQTTPTSPTGAGRGMVNPPAVNPLAPPPVAAPSIATTTEPSTSSAATTSNVTRLGNSYSGTNVAGDITVNGRAPGGGFMNTGSPSVSTGKPSSSTGMAVDQAQRQGTPSPQNMTAADNLAATQQQGARGRLMALAGGPGSGPVEPGRFTGGYSGVIGSASTYGNMRGRSPEQRLRDAEVSASSITNRPKWGGRGADNSAAMVGYRAALQQDSNIRQNEAGADLETIRQSGSLQREGMQQAGETQRTGIRAQGVDAANQIARGRLSLEQIAAGYTNRSADRLDRAQAELEGAKTPEAQKSARERLMALAGQAPQNEWGVQVTPTTKNADGSSTQGSVYRFNRATGETVRVDEGQGNAGQAPAKDNMVRGQVYQTRGGPMRWNGSSFERVG